MLRREQARRGSALRARDGKSFPPTTSSCTWRYVSDAEVRGLRLSQPWMFGEWRCVEELTGRSGGEEELQELSAACEARLAREVEDDKRAGQGASSAEGRSRFYSTLADSLENNLRVNLGLGVPRAEVRSVRTRKEGRGGRDADKRGRERNNDRDREAAAGWQAGGCQKSRVQHPPRVFGAHSTSRMSRQGSALRQQKPDTSPAVPRRARGQSDCLLPCLIACQGGGAKVDLLITDRTRCGSGDSFSCSESFRATETRADVQGEDRTRRAELRRDEQVEQELHLAADGNVSGKKFIDLDLPGSLKVRPNTLHPQLAAQQAQRLCAHAAMRQVTCELGLVLSRKLGDDESM
eukprot:755587-Hanusia_phi.AAC.4